MSYYQCYCECPHREHHEGGPGHPFSVKISNEEMVPLHWEKSHQVQVCRPCVHAGHIQARVQ